MILTPKELFDRRSKLKIMDVRPDSQREEFPINGLNTINVENGDLPKGNGKKVLICQFGIVTEGMIIENNLKDTYSLLGGAQAWEEYYKDKLDYSIWSRQTVLPEIGIEGQKKIGEAKVAIIGMGGLGCPISSSLITAGIGQLHLIDGDTISLSNLHRQPLFNTSDVGKKKVNVAKEKLKPLHPNSFIHIHDTFLNKENASSLLNDVDVIIDASDNIKTRLVIDHFSKRNNIPMVYGGLFRFEGHVSILSVNGSPSYSDVFPEQSSSGDTCADAGVLGMLPGIIGNIQALETIKLILGIEPNLIGKLLIYDGMNQTIEIIKLG